MATPATTLINGASMPLLGFGTWLSEPTVVGESVEKALRIGYRHIDCAHIYGNEAEVGEAFTRVFADPDIKLKREDVFVTSKLWVADFNDVQAACDKTLKNLKLDYLDLYLIHLPFEVDPKEFKVPPEPKGHGIIGYTPERIEEVWREMEKIVNAGKAKAIGISNFTTQKVENLLKCKVNVKIACNQVELSPYCPQHGLKDYCEKNKIVMVAYAPLGSPGRPDIFKEDSDPHLMSDAVVEKVAKKHNITPAQVLLAYGLNRKTVVLCKSVTEKRIKENFESLNVNLDTGDMADLNGIKKRHRFCKQGWARKPDEEFKDLWTDGE